MPSSAYLWMKSAACHRPWPANQAIRVPVALHHIATLHSPDGSAPFKHKCPINFGHTCQCRRQFAMCCILCNEQTPCLSCKEHGCTRHDNNFVVPAGQGEFSAVGFSYGGSAESSQAGTSAPVEDLGEEGSSDSESGQCSVCCTCMQLKLCRSWHWVSSAQQVWTKQVVEQQHRPGFLSHSGSLHRLQSCRFAHKMLADVMQCQHVRHEPLHCRW